MLKYVRITIVVLLCYLILFSYQVAAKSSIRYDNLSSLTESQQIKVKNWVEFGVAASKASLGELPQPYIPFYLKPRYFAFEPVPWASVKRGNVSGIELHFGRYASLNDLKADWTLYHEIAHLYHPYFDYRDFWLAEGFASYMQNVIMLQNGVISRQGFVQRLLAGLERGQLNTRAQPGSLSDVSENMWQRRAYQRVYWSGAAFFIEADYLLRKQRKAPLTALIKNYQSCCKEQVNGETQQSAAQFITHLDKLSRSRIFSQLYRQYQNRRDFPRISKQQIELIVMPKTFSQVLIETR